jgi:hypothetical protein
VRLIFEYEGDQVRLVSQQSVDVAVTGFDIARTQQPGYYIDTRDAGGQTLARVPARGAFAGSVEVFPEQANQPITRVNVPVPQGAFTVVVPVPAGADHVSVVRVAPPKPEAALPPGAATTAVPGGGEVNEIATFPLNVSN